MLNNTGMIKNSVNHFAYMSGYSDGTFRPKNAITRAEFAKIICELSQNYNISNKDDLADLQTEISNSVVDGYYVFTGDIINPTNSVDSVQGSEKGIFKGTDFGNVP